MATPRSLTIKDVAAMAGVSQGTVSKVLNEAPGVGAATRERVLKLIQDLDYHPNASARSLVARKTGNIGVIIPHTGTYSLSTAYWPRLLTSITDTAAARGQNVLLSTARSEEDADSAYRSILRGRRVDGLIVGAEQFQPKQLADLLFKGFPFVMVGMNPVVQHWHVDVDNAGGARTMTQHLLRLGHRRIALLGGLESFVHIRERVRGYREAMEEAGLEPHICYCPYEKGTARTCIGELLEGRPGITALFVTAGDYTTDALGVLRELGVRVPSDVALVAFDDHPHFQYFAPPLTVMKQPVRALGEAAVEMLFDLMEGREPDERFRVLPTSLVVRASCGTSPPGTPPAA